MTSARSGLDLPMHTNRSQLLSGADWISHILARGGEGWIVVCVQGERGGCTGRAFVFKGCSPVIAAPLTPLVSLMPPPSAAHWTFQCLGASGGGWENLPPIPPAPTPPCRGLQSLPCWPLGLHSSSVAPHMELCHGVPCEGAKTDSASQRVSRTGGWGVTVTCPNSPRRQKP